MPAALARHRSPGRYTFVLNGTGLMGGTETRYGTEYRSFKPEDQGQVSPTDFGYGADSPFFGAITSYGPFPLGMGLRAQRKSNAALDLQYDHTLGVDASVYPIVKGPDVTLFTPAVADAVNGVVKFIKVGGTLFAITGRYALYRASDTSWPLDKDFDEFASGHVALDAASFFCGDPVITLETGHVGFGESFDMQWTQGVGVWSTAGFRARAWGLAGREFYRADTTRTLAKVDTDTDTKVAANWQADNAFGVGDRSSAIVRLATTASGILLAIKTDGIYTLDGAGDDLKLHSFPVAADAGKAVARWGNDLYVSFGASGFWRFDATGESRQQVGPELLTDGSNVVNGVVTACVGVEGAASALWAGIHNPDTGASYLCRFLGVADGRPIWHGSLTQDLGSKITAMAVDSAGAPTDHLRMYLGFADGRIGWFTLPCKAHPSDCSAYRFTTTNGTLRIPTWDAGFGANVKALDTASVTGRTLSASNFVSVRTRSDPAGSWSPLSDNFDTGQREEVAFPAASSATILDAELTLVNAANTSSPEVTGFGIRHQVQTPYRQVYTIRVLAENDLRCRDGTRFALGADRVRDVVEAAHDAAGSVPLVLPEGDAVRVRVKGIGKTVAFEQPYRRPRAAYALECVQVSTSVVYGTHARMEALGSHAALEARTHGQLENL